MKTINDFRHSSGGVELYDYQAECVFYVWMAFVKGLQGGFAVLPTGSGKTVIASALIYLALRAKQRILVVVPGVELVGQWTGAIKQASPSAFVTVISEGRADCSGQVVVAGQRMLTKSRLAQMSRTDFDIVIIDEAHHAASPDWLRIIEHFHSQFLLGLSATPVRGDGKCASDIFYDTILYIIGLRRLIQLGQLVDAKGYRIGTDVDLSGVEISSSGGDYNQIQLAETVNVRDRNDTAVRAFIKYGERNSAIAFGVNVSHAQQVAAAFNSANISAAAIYNSMPSDERKRLTEACRSGDLQVLTNFFLVAEGFDAKRVKCVLLLRPFTNRSARVMLPQMVGRALRTFENHKYAVIIELIDQDRRRKGLNDISSLSAFGLGDCDRYDVETEGRLVSEIANEVEEKKQKNLRESLRKKILRLPAIEQFSGARLAAEDVEAVDYIHIIEQLSGLTAIVVNGMYCIPLTPRDGKSRVMTVEKTSGLFEAKILSDTVEHFTVGKTLEETVKTAKTKLLMNNESLAFSRSNAAWRHDKMSDKQRQHLTRLSGEDLSRVRDDFSRGEASDIITMYEAANYSRRANRM
jgi:superfamily II DNA or RNA helicase